MGLLIIILTIFFLFFAPIMYISYRKEQKSLEEISTFLEESRATRFKIQNEMHQRKINSLKQKIQATQEIREQRIERNHQPSAAIHVNAIAATTGFVAAAAVTSAFDEEGHGDEYDEEYEDYEEVAYEQDEDDYDADDAFETGSFSSYTSYEEENDWHDDPYDDYDPHDPYTNPGVDLVIDEVYHGIDHFD